jgi:hypothetical protein
MRTALDSYQSKAEERDALVETLRMWNKVEEQGIDPEDVARFALKTEFMNHIQLQHYRELKFAKGGKPFTLPDGRQRCKPTHANCVILKTGEVVELNPWVYLP